MPLTSPGAGLHPVDASGQLSASLHPVGSSGQHSSALHPVGGPGGGGGGNTHPLLAQAIASTRDALQQDPSEADPRLLLEPRALGNDFALCEPWVRVALGSAQAMSSLRFSGATLWHLPLVVNAAGVPQPSTPLPLITMRAPPPEVLRHAVLAVIDAAAERADRLPEILTQTDDFWSFWAAVLGIHPARAPRTAELVGVAYHLATAVALRFKHELALRRPGAVSPLVQPVIPVPGHAALPSGHATVAFLFAELAPLLLRLPARALLTVQLRRLAERIAHNRVVAGVHYPMDGWAGRLLGQVLGQYLAALCGGGALTIAGASALLSLSEGVGAADHALALQPADAAAIGTAIDDGSAIGSVYLPGSGSLPAQDGPYPTLRTMWQAAEAELDALGVLRV